MPAMGKFPDVRRGVTRRQLLKGSTAAIGLGLVSASVQAAYLVKPWDARKPVPKLELDDLAGKPWSLAGARGQVVVMNFWATWCEPCRAEMPVFERAQQQYRDQGLVVLGVDMQEQDPEIIAFLSQIGVTFPTAADRTGEVTRQWRATGLPTTFLIDRQGIIRDVRVGAFTDGMLEERLTKVLSQ